MIAELTRAAVLSAVKEYDDKGARQFLSDHGFRAARGYFLVWDGRAYDSKAIVAAAHQYLPTRRALTPYELIGGKNDAAKKLLALGFEVSSPGDNADWTWDEHVIALNLYFDLSTRSYAKTDPAILDTSDLLRALALHNGKILLPTFRNGNGVYMKLMNFRRLDPEFTSRGRTGLSRGSKGEVEVWERFANDRDGLKAAATLIRQLIDTAAASIDEAEGSEGSIIIRTHKARERDPTLVAKKKKAFIAESGRLACEVCEFDFAQRYGAHGEAFIEVHHIDPIALSKPGRKTRLDQLACVCSNCHRMLHRHGLQTLDWLRDQLR